MKALIKFIVLLVSTVCVLSCTSNVMVEFSDPSTDEALYYSAKFKLNDGDFTGAITDIGNMSDSSDRDTQYLLASAYAARCGYNELDVMTKLSSLTGNLYEYLMTEYTGATLSEVNDCIQAEDILQNIGAAASRNAKENIFMAMLALTKIGVILTYNADTDEDDVLDGGFDACNAGSISDVHAQHVGIGLNEFILSLSALGSSIGGGAATDLQAACTAIALLGPQYDFCSDTEPADFDADKTKAARTFIHEGDSIGLGSCGNVPPDIGNCLCP